MISRVEHNTVITFGLWFIEKSSYLKEVWFQMRKLSIRDYTTRVVKNYTSLFNFQRFATCMYIVSYKRSGLSKKKSIQKHNDLTYVKKQTENQIWYISNDNHQAISSHWLVLDVDILWQD